jgi:hypothetical protein
MTPQDDPREAGLRQLFSARKRRDEDAAPEFERLLRRPARARVGQWSWAAAAALLLVLVAVGIVWRARSGETPPRTAAVPAQPTLATWKAPTDFLLNVPGGELLNSTPAFSDPTKEIL